MDQGYAVAPARVSLHGNPCMHVAIYAQRVQCFSRLVIPPCVGLISDVHGAELDPWRQHAHLLGRAGLLLCTGAGYCQDQEPPSLSSTANCIYTADK